MKKLLIAAVLALGCANLAACATLPDGNGAEALTIAAEAAEVSTRLRCPRNLVEISVLLSLRMGFDLSTGVRLSQAQRDRLVAVRAETDRFCGIVPAA